MKMTLAIPLVDIWRACVERDFGQHKHRQYQHEDAEDILLYISAELTFPSTCYTDH